MALAHELAHLQRGDLHLSLVPHLAQLLFFFHPLAGLACREWAMAREAACDAAALRATGEPPVTYGRLLVKLAANHRGAAALPTLGATAGFRTLQRRLKMLELSSLSPRRWWRLGLTVLVTAGALSVIPWRLVARAAPPSAKPVAAALSPGAEQQLAACEENLREIGRAMAAYRRDRGELPAHLSDLFPRYVTDLKRLHCPADRTDGSPRRSDDYDDVTAPPADPRPVSYAYMMSPVKPHVGFGGLGGPLPRNADWSWRGQMMAMRANYGDRVPVVRCWHHAPTMFEVVAHPLVPNLTLDGAVYRSAAAWQIDPGTMSVVVRRMESDLAEGVPQFLKRWNLGSIAGQFSHVEPIPALSTRCRVMATKLEAMAGQPLKADQVTHLPTDLPAAVGSLYRMAGDTDRAIAAYQQAIDHLDLTVRYYHGGEITAAGSLPALYAAKGQHDKAIAVYRRIVLKDPEKWDWYIAMAREYEAMGQTGKAVALRQQWDPSGQLLNKPAPEFEMLDEAGRQVSLAKLRGRVVVLFFWHTAYPRQAEVARELDALQRKYQSQGLSVLCLARRSDLTTPNHQVPAPANHSYPLLLGADAIYNQYGVQDSSMLFIVDPRGKLITRYVGYGYDPGEERWLEQTVRKMLAPQPEAMGPTVKAVALRQKSEPSGQLLNKPAPVLSGCDEDGHSIDLPKLRGRVVVLYFRNSRYPGQDVVMRELDALQRRYDGQGLSVVCLARLVDMGMAAEQAPKGHSYPLLLGADFIYDRYGVDDSSMLYIVDQQGKVVQRYPGYGYDPREERRLEQTVRQMLAPQVTQRPAGAIHLAGNSVPARPEQRQPVALRQKSDTSGRLVGKPAPEFADRDAKGRPGNFADLRGRVVVLFFRNSAYPRQDVVMRELDTLQRHYAGQGLSVVCLSRLVDMGAAKAQAPKNYAYQLLSGMDFIYDRYGVGDRSMLFVVDQKGKVVQQHPGYGYDPGEERWLEQTIRELLAPQVAERQTRLNGGISPAGILTLEGNSNASAPAGRQVLVRARIMAINRQRSRELGIDWGAAGRPGRVLTISQPVRLGARAGVSLPPSNPIGAAVRSLEQQNALRVLCECPVHIRGHETGGIHIGGEIPIPGVRGKDGNAASISYQPYGIMLWVGLLGTNEEGISLRLRNGVSRIDPSRSVNRNGTTVQELQSQHAERVVRFRPGDSVVIAGGLLQDQAEQNEVLAEVFKSRRSPSGESDLVIVVTPELAEEGERHGV
jgi:peroxiredoxin